MAHLVDLLVIGAGPGGYAAAFRAADLGRDVTLVDGRNVLGGVCLNEGCIPSKALLHAAEVIREASHIGDWGIALGTPEIDLDVLRGRKDGIVDQLTTGLTAISRRRKVTVRQGMATFKSPTSVVIDGIETEFKQAIVAIGSRPITLPGWPDDPRIWDSTDALALKHIPKRLAIVGGGIIGLEMATIYAALGSKVEVIELGAQLAPGADGEAVSILQSALEADGVTVRTGTRVESVKTAKAALTLHCTGTFPGATKADAIVQAVGRRANGDRIGAEKGGLTVAANGVIDADIYGRTSQPNLFAVGDVTGGPMLAHRATHQGHIAAEVACGHKSAFDTTLIPSVAYTNPELAWVGQMEAEPGEPAVKTTSFPWAASGRNLASGGGNGLTKLAYEAESNRLVGGTIVGRNAGELLAELTLAIEMGATIDDIALTVHAHPTLSETTAFAAERALGTLTDL